MMFFKKVGLFVLSVIACTYQLQAQELERKLLDWQSKSLYVGPVLAEKGAVTVEFLARNPHTDAVAITDVVTDCGCTLVDFSKDTVETNGLISLKVSYESDYRGGDFSKIILVRTTLDIYGDTLIIEGSNFPVVDDASKNFPYLIGNLGFRLPTLNLGQVFTNEPKVKFYDVFNFGSDTLTFRDFALQEWPAYLQVILDPMNLPPGSRGLLSVSFDAKKFDDFGYHKNMFEVKLLGEEQPLEIPVAVTVFEYFEAVPKSMEKIVPKLQLSEVEIDFKDIPASRVVHRTVQVSNQGQEPLLIRKIITSCDCVEINLPDREIFPGEKAELQIRFDPQGRRGIDHKHITLYTNDPITPVRTLTLRSLIK
jgi:hypothetical protein